MSSTDEIQVEAGSIDRLVLMERVCNFRSVGGLLTADGTKIVRHGFLYRSSHFDDATASDLQRLMDTSNDKMYVKTIVDLRDKGDAADDDDTLLRQKYNEEGKIRHHCRKGKTFDDDGGEYRWVNIPILTMSYKINVLKQTPGKHKVIGKALFKGKNDAAAHVVDAVLNKQGLRGQYEDMIEHSQKRFLDVLELIASSKDKCDGPIAVHCEHGKDRTGIVILLVYACLGVSEDDIIADYALSYQGLKDMREKMRKEMMEDIGLNEEFIQSPPDVMRDTISHLKEKFGGILGYLTKIGFDDKKQQKLRDHFLHDMT